jgi:SpoIID/LytB domain protein
METPVVNVGVLTEKAVEFVFNEGYVHTESGDILTGEQQAQFMNGRIVFNKKRYKELFFEPLSQTATFDLKAVTVGADFHWQRKEDQRFYGALNLVAVDGGILAINQVDAEKYLESVIASEMSGTASLEFLKAHAVISRSWLFVQMEKALRPSGGKEGRCHVDQTEDERICWYDRERHTMFDVCADDHCQRYRGISISITNYELRITNPPLVNEAMTDDTSPLASEEIIGDTSPLVSEEIIGDTSPLASEEIIDYTSPLVSRAIDETRGEMLTMDGTVCDARFSKCCGGVTESFEHVWEPVPHPYLTALRDSEEPLFPDLTVEANADQWIRHSPEAFCHTAEAEILEQVLTPYDRETADFYRWTVCYTQEELSELISRKSGMDFGEIIDLIPLQRGKSGRIEKLRIVGSALTFTIGKELEIRRTLSETHLYSSAFVVDKEYGEGEVPSRFVLTGAGWGHGVGLCQIGAAVMGAQGYTYRQILEHYYPGTDIKTFY